MPDIAPHVSCKSSLTSVDAYRLITTVCRLEESNNGGESQTGSHCVEGTSGTGSLQCVAEERLPSIATVLDVVTLPGSQGQLVCGFQVHCCLSPVSCIPSCTPPCRPSCVSSGGPSCVPSCIPSYSSSCIPSCIPYGMPSCVHCVTFATGQNLLMASCCCLTTTMTHVCLAVKPMLCALTAKRLDFAVKVMYCDTPCKQSDILQLVMWRQRPCLHACSAHLLQTNLDSPVRIMHCKIQCKQAHMPQMLIPKFACSHQTGWSSTPVNSWS